MSTTRTQRIGIWIIAVFMAVGTVGSFAIIILSTQNNQTDQKKIEEMTAQYQADSAAYQAKVDAQANELSTTYYAQFSAYSGRVGAYEASSIPELKVEDLLEGTGDILSAASSFSAYYIGWGPDGKIFDSSIEGEALKAPIAVVPGGVIEGWSQGVAGMKVGGVRELSIPADLAYGETGSGDAIAPNTPIKFVMMVIPSPAAIDQPVIPPALLRYYQTGRLS